MNTMVSKIKAIAVSGFTAAILDIAGAIITYAFVLGLTTPQRVLQSVAAGALGKKSFSGGWNTALAGLALHTLIAFIFAAFYCLIYPYWTRIFKNTFVAGFVYGCLVWSIMNFGVLPIATGKPFVFNMKFFLIGIGLIIFLVGIPIAIITRKILQGSGRDHRP